VNRFNTSDNPSPGGQNGRQLVIVGQLFRAAVYMRHIDEMFEWLARVIVQGFDVQVVQFWAMEGNRTGKVSVELRTLAGQEVSLPQHIFTNNQVAATAAQILTGKRSYLLQMISNIFSAYQASLLSRYGLNYCSCIFLTSDRLLPPAHTAASTQYIPVPFEAVVLLFLRQPVPNEALSAIKLILEQSIPLAGNRGLLLPAISAPGSNGSLKLESQFTLPELIPHRIEDANLMTSSNPLAGSVVISDKQARRLYPAIDGHQNVNEICADIGMDLKDAYVALEFLLGQHRVQLTEPGGRIVDSSLFFGKL
jgi:hypothetical protein